MADHRRGVEELEAQYGRTWVIRTDLAIGVAAWRRVNLPANRLGRTGVNVLAAGDLDELGDKLAEQESAALEGRVLPPGHLALVAAAHNPPPTRARPRILGTSLPG
ncbi:hypothetical protein ACIBP6_05520 [Nonomuraea terrae]|uniref:hypothetical protein n=1 Tax=Nonomuraea terrae TaxID=2530383 RepID=UPI0037A696D0